MTNKQKIAILKKMREILASGRQRCFCFAYLAAKKKAIIYYDTLPDVIEGLGLKKPKVTVGPSMWYTLTPAGIKTRIRKIDELIKRLSK